MYRNLSLREGKLCSSEKTSVDCCRVKIVESEEELPFVQKPQFERGKLCSSEKPYVDLLNSEEKLPFVQKPQFERGKLCSSEKPSVDCRVKMLVRINCHLCRNLSLREGKLCSSE